MRALVAGVVEEGDPLGSGGAMEILPLGSGGAMEILPLGSGGAMEILPLGSGGVVEIPQKGIRWGAAGLWKYHRRESAGEQRGSGMGLGNGGSLKGIDTPE